MPAKMESPPRDAAGCLCAGATRGVSIKSERALMPVNEYSAEIVDIGVSRSRLKQITQAFEEPGGIVFGKKRGGIEAEIPRPRERGVVNKGASRIIRAAATAVGAVGIAGNCCDSRRGPERLGERQSVFLIRTAASLAANGHGEFAT